MSSPPDYIPSEAYNSGRVSPADRHKRAGDCPICEGGDSMKRRRGERCTGFTTPDGRYAFCSREERAGPLPLYPTTPPAYKHKLDGPCKCGENHGNAPLPLRRCETLPAQPPKRSHLLNAPTAIYSAYANGLRKLRYGSGKGKWFVWQHDAGEGQWLDGREGREPGLYRVGDLEMAPAYEPIFLVEGEGKADALTACGAVALSVPDGAGSWRADYAASFTGVHLVILIDADEQGQMLGQVALADTLAVAASVRVIELEGAHDVADWLADGHPFSELLKISACSPPAQQSNPALQDGPIVETLKRENAQLREQLAIAEKSLAHLRARQAMAERIMALPKEQLSPPLKPAAIAVQNVLSRPRARNEQGMEQVYRAEIARQCGVSDKTAGAYLRDLAHAGVIHREVVKSFDRSEIYISEGPLFDKPEEIATPERANTWGGKRVKRCTSCGSANLEIRVICRDCGEILSRDDVNKEEEPQDAPQDMLPPPDMRVSHLAPIVRVPTVPHCPQCGAMGGDDLHDYGDGILRCKVHDEPAITA